MRILPNHFRAPAAPHDGAVYQVVETQCANAAPTSTPLLARDKEMPLSNLLRVELAEL
jgi:hypothetical protein